MTKRSKKGIVKKVVIGIAIILVLVGITYATVPPVKEAVDKIIDKIVDVLPGGNIRLEELEAVKNISYDEKTRILTFDENLKAKSYVIIVNHNGITPYQINSQIGSAKLYPSNSLMDGDIVSLEVTAKGDNVTTRDSKKVVYNYTVQFANESLYSYGKTTFESFISKSISNFKEFRVKSLDAKSFKLDDDNLLIEGTGTSARGIDVNFSINYNITNFKLKNSADFANLNNFVALINYMNNNPTKHGTIKVEYSNEFVDFTSVLEEKGAFDEYINAGYQIEVLQHSNTEVMRDGNENYIMHTAIYKATHTSKPTVTFKKENKVAIENGKTYASVSKFLEDAEIDSVVSTQAKEVHDQLLNNYLKEMLNAKDFNQKTTS